MATYYVTKAGHDTTGDGSESTPWLTVSKAVTVAKAVAGSHTIMIGPGTYNEQVNCDPTAGGMTAVKLQGATGVRTEVVIHNASTGFGVARADGILETLEAEDLTLSTGTLGVISCPADADVVLTNVDLINTSATSTAGGIYWSATSTPTRSNLTWVGGSCTLAGASASCVAWYTSTRYIGRVYIEDVTMNCAYVAGTPGNVTETNIKSLDIVDCPLNVTNTIVHLFNTTTSANPMTQYCDWVSVRGCTGTTQRMFRIHGGVANFEFAGNTLSVTCGGAADDGRNGGTLGVEVRTDTISAWSAAATIALNADRRPTTNIGVLVRCTARAGDFKTGAVEPTWGAVGSTHVDNNVTWTVIAAETTNAMPILAGRIQDNVLDWPSTTPNAGATHNFFLGVGANNIMVQRNTLTTASPATYNMVVCKSDYCTFQRNLITCTADYPVYLAGARYSRFINNTVVASGANRCVAVDNHQEAVYSLLNGVPRGNIIEGNVLVSATGQPITVNVSGGALVDRNLYWTGGANVAYVIDASVATSGGIAAVQAKWASAGTGIETRNDADSIVADPLFKNAAGGDYALAPNSPARGAGSEDGTLDLGAYQSVVAIHNRLFTFPGG